MTTVAALETVGLGRRYGTKWGLRDCSLTVPEGSITGLVGPNGAGKSTLAAPGRGALPTHGGDRQHLRRTGRSRTRLDTSVEWVTSTNSDRCMPGSRVDETLRLRPEIQPAVGQRRGTQVAATSSRCH